MTPKEALDRHVHPDLTQKWAQPVLEAVLAAFDTYHAQQLRPTLLEFHKAIIPEDVADKIPYTREEIVGAFIISQQ